MLPHVQRLLLNERANRGAHRLFEIGCGNGAVASNLSGLGFDVTATDISTSGIEIARAAFPIVRFEIASSYDDLYGRFSSFPIVLSLEVIEHLYAPRLFLANVFKLLERGGLVVLSTPYHGYAKNLALALAGQMDAHFTALWDHGHIKFWSVKTLSVVLSETGFVDLRFQRVGRIPILAKTLLVSARRP